MELLFSVALLVLILLFYLSGRKNRINIWCAFAGFIFWIGIFKEAILYYILPYMQNLTGKTGLLTAYMPIYSIQTWALYTFAMPTAVIFALFFCGFDENHPKFIRRVAPVIYLPGVILSFFFPPLLFRIYQLQSASFWIAFSVYNLSLVLVYSVLIICGIKKETNAEFKKQKRNIMLVTLPPVVFWALSVFLTHPFKLERYFKLWQLNVIIILICIAIFLIASFKKGFMGLKLSGNTYNWSSDMDLINKGAEYTSHMLKNQTSKIEWCIENLKAQFQESGEGSPPEELAIMSRSIDTIKALMEKMKKHSESIVLLEQTWNLRSLIEEAASPKPNVIIDPSVTEQITCVCDRHHMGEVFENIISNALEASGDSGRIIITGNFERGQKRYHINISDKGSGMGENELSNMFLPYFTTKNSKKHFGLGLAYCKNVVEKHGGNIYAKSVPGSGTTVTIALPADRMGETA